ILNENDLPVIDPKLLGTNLIKQPPMVNANCYDPSQRLNCETTSIYTKGDTANYIFEYIGNSIIVTVYNIIFPNNKTPTNGSKYCFKSVDNHGGYLYPAIVSGTNVQCNETPVANLSRYYSNDDNQRITYNKGDWTMKKNNYNIVDQIEDIKKPSFAPGVILFKGNLNLENGVYNNTILSTGNITSSNGRPLITAPNYAEKRTGTATVICHTKSNLNKDRKSTR